MFKIVKIFIVSQVLNFGLFAQKENEIYWSKELKLTWDDYRGPSEPGINGAISMTGIQYKSSFKKDTLVLFVVAMLDKRKSWVKKEYNSNVDLLIHEQGHFDLSELYTRRLRKALIDFKFNGDKDKAFEEAKKIQSALKAELNAANTLYDQETDYSENTAKQSEWTKKLREEIAALDQYCSSTIKVLIH